MEPIDLEARVVDQLVELLDELEDGTSGILEVLLGRSRDMFFSELSVECSIIHFYHAFKSCIRDLFQNLFPLSFSLLVANKLQLLLVVSLYYQFELVLEGCGRHTALVATLLRTH